MTIETPRLILRPPVAADRAALHAIWRDPLVMADLGPVKTAAESDATLARHAAYPNGLGFNAVVRRDDSAVIGFCGLKPGAPDTPIAGEVEAGWVIARAYWRHGYALEAMLGVLDWCWAHTDAPRVVAITARRNAKSRGMMQRLGMSHRPELDFVHPQFGADDPLADVVTYALPRP
ncbi:GNAT family N-acetyltransferase [Sphingomonas sp.]|uniref:GNAT family N-acetyltransferase n=1 Tax=Sphingomonas sp. TaxID=28214 RepID=UPI0035C80554